MSPKTVNQTVELLVTLNVEDGPILDTEDIDWVKAELTQQLERLAMDGVWYSIEHR